MEKANQHTLFVLSRGAQGYKLSLADGTERDGMKFCFTKDGALLARTDVEKILGTNLPYEFLAKANLTIVETENQSGQEHRVLSTIGQDDAMKMAESLSTPGATRLKEIINEICPAPHSKGVTIFGGKKIGGGKLTVIVEEGSWKQWLIVGEVNVILGASSWASEIRSDPKEYKTMSEEVAGRLGLSADNRKVVGANALILKLKKVYEDKNRTYTARQRAKHFVDIVSPYLLDIASSYLLDIASPYLELPPTKVQNNKPAFASVLEIERKTGETYPWFPLKSWCEKTGFAAKKIALPGIGFVMEYPGEAWEAVNGVRI